MDWMLMPLRRYADFSGRSRRKEFWMFFLFNVIVSIAMFTVLIVGAVLSDTENDRTSPLLWIGLALTALWSLAIVIPTIAVHVRRFHDQEQSGWMYLINFVPLIGGLIVLVFMLLPGTKGPNRYGPDPKG